MLHKSLDLLLKSWSVFSSSSYSVFLVTGSLSSNSMVQVLAVMAFFHTRTGASHHWPCNIWSRIIRIPQLFLHLTTFLVEDSQHSDNHKPGSSDGSCSSFTTSCLALVATLVATLATAQARTSRLQTELLIIRPSG